MAITLKINPRDTYSICGLVDGTVTAVNKETDAQIILCTFTAGNEAFFSGSPLIKDNTVTISDDNAIWAPRPFRAAAAGSSSGGGEGGTSAGFGVPTAEATALAPGAQPTVEVSASGSNTAKIFNFSFGIPQGAQGPQGETGPAGPQGPAGEPGLTTDQINTLTTYASAEGQNITPDAGGTFATQVGHTYVVTAGASAVTVSAGSELSFEVTSNAQRGFVATTTTATVSTADCVVTEVFKPAAPIELSSSGGGGSGDTTNTLKYTFNGSYYSVEGDLSGMTNGSSMFKSSRLVSITCNLPSLETASEMFWAAGALQSFNVSALPNLKTANAMFQSTGIVEWHIDLPALTTGLQMFYGAGSLTSFTGALPALATGTSMFHDTRLEAFESDLPSLTNGTTMFNHCVKLASFSGDLPALTTGTNMFGSNSSNCTRLNLASLQHIAATINNLTAVGKTGNISLGIQSALISDDETAPINVALAAIRAKGWTVTEIYRA